jgi:hypothetical protein
MSGQKQSKHIGRKIWYSAAIFLSSLVILLSTVSVVGTWIVENAVSDAAVTMFGVVHATAGQVRKAGSEIDLKLAEVQGVTTNIAGVTGQLSQNIQDQGILLTLLPEEQEQKLVGAVKSVVGYYNDIKEVLLNGIKLYRSIDSMPFISLPKLSTGQADKIEAAITDIDAAAAELQGNIQQVRSGAADAVAKVESKVNQITQRLGETRDNLAELDVKLASLQDLMLRLQQVVPVLLIILTLFAAWIIYTQVEVIRLFVKRWRSLGKSPAALPPTEESPEELPLPAAELQSAPETPADSAMVHIIPTDQAPADESPDP